MGAWIETVSVQLNAFPLLSHPMWVRGLKLLPGHNLLIVLLVAPYVGAWIETSEQSDNRVVCKVAPYVGAWIETGRCIGGRG